MTKSRPKRAPLDLQHVRGGILGAFVEVITSSTTSSTPTGPKRQHGTVNIAHEWDPNTPSL